MEDVGKTMEARERGRGSGERDETLNKEIEPLAKVSRPGERIPASRLQSISASCKGLSYA